MSRTKYIRTTPRKAFMQLLAGFMLAASGVGSLQAQTVSTYTFAQTSGTYNNLTGGTVLVNGDFDNSVYTVSLPTAFPFAGTYYNTMYVSTNGFLTFGSAPTSTNYSPLSSSEGYAGAISAFGADIEDAQNGTREVRWNTVGNEVVVQWRDVRRNITGSSEQFSAQARMNTATGVITMRYFVQNGANSSTSFQPQVGLRGPNNTFSTNVNNRRVGTGSETWATSLAGNANNNTMRFTSSFPAREPADGQTYTFTPPCLPPTTANAGNAQSICNGLSASLSANVPAIGSGSWSVVSGPSTSNGQFSNTAAANSQFTPAGGAGTYTLRWTISNAPCTANSDDVAITVVPSPALPIITPTSATICQGSGTALVGSAASASTTFNGGAITIQFVGSTPYPSTIAVSGLPTSGVTVASVQLNGLSHNNPDDIDLLLRSPLNTNVVLMSDVGGTADVTNQNYVLQDGAPLMSDNSFNASGTYRPTNFETTDNWTTLGNVTQANPQLSSFSGNMNGNWGLYAMDDNGNMINGSMASWSITFNIPMGYAWAPAAGLSATNVASVTASPGSTTTYTLTVTNPSTGCTSSATATVNVNTPANPGTNASLQTCELDAPIDLFAQLGGTPQGGGTWAGPSTLAGSMFNPATMTAGAYVYTVAGAAPCPDASATVNVTVATSSIWYADVDGDGAGDANSSLTACDQPAGYVADNSDLCPTDASKVLPGICGCGTADTDSDSDGTPDCNDLCPNDPNKVAPGECGCGVADTDTDGDGIADCIDICPAGPNPGSPCNDGNPFTTGDVILYDCSCAGTPVPCDTWSLNLTTDANGAQTTWQIQDATSPFILASGGPYPSNAVVQQTFCVPHGAEFVLSVFDSFGDGMTTGGFVLRDHNGRRVIDNTGNGSGFTTVSAVAQGFSSPVGTDQLTITTCDRLDMIPTGSVIATPNALVSGQYNVSNANSGYQFWIYNPHGGYTRRVLLTHANPGSGGGNGATRACHLRLSDITANPVPQNELLNVRVRSMVNGTYSAFGPACRMKIDVVAAACPMTKLDDYPLNIGTTYSCGVTGLMLDGSSTIWAKPVVNPWTTVAANKYQFEFSIPAEGYMRRTVSNNYALVLQSWATNPLQYGSTYDVRVRASFDGGTNWCPWGDVCTITIAPEPNASYNQFTNDRTLSNDLVIWPNPNDGRELRLNLNGLAEEEQTIGVDIVDVHGRVVFNHNLATAGGMLSAVIDLNNDLSDGLYLVHVRTNTGTHVQRLVVQ
ncbi:MAG: T9SS type A sorting domain-containing protein [Flavobacteriales bacterium]|nr:T9SS type A sorting domain-containing protein [Flavobacteriales bacterium]